MNHKTRNKSRSAAHSYQPLEPKQLLATFVVNTADDVDDQNCNVVHCSLREAINEAELTSAKDTIEFAIPGNQVHTIRPLTDAYQRINHPIEIDARTQFGYNGIPRIVLDGSLVEDDAANSHQSGLGLNADDSEIFGLSIVSFPDFGVRVAFGANNTIQGNYLGLLPNQSAAGNGNAGLILIHSPDNLVGGSISERNIISGGDNDGIWVFGSGSTNNTIQHNYIGTDKDGVNSVPNLDHGIFLSDGAHHNTMRDNIVSGNGDVGISFFNAGTDHNEVMDNLIGVNIRLRPLANTSHGVSLYDGPSDNVIGAPGDGNTISGNHGNGVFLYGAATSDNVIQSNRIGTTVIGDATPNTRHGITIRTGANANLIEANVISGNLRSGVSIEDPETDGNELLGNFIGVDLHGEPLPNSFNGIHLFEGPSNNVIGSPGHGNIISANGINGVEIQGAETSGNVLQGNLIGTNTHGHVVPNGRHGVWLRNETHSNLIGGT